MSICGWIRGGRTVHCLGQVEEHPEGVLRAPTAQHAQLPSRAAWWPDLEARIPALHVVQCRVPVQERGWAANRAEHSLAEHSPAHAAHACARCVEVGHRALAAGQAACKPDPSSLAHRGVPPPSPPDGQHRHVVVLGNHRKIVLPGGVEQGRVGAMQLGLGNPVAGFRGGSKVAGSGRGNPLWPTAQAGAQPCMHRALHLQAAGLVVTQQAANGCSLLTQRSAST